MSRIEIKDDILIGKDALSVWTILSDINSWRFWSGVIDRAAMYGPARAGTAFKCLADKWDFECIIDEAIPGEKFHIRGKTIGLNVVMRWQIAEAPSGIKVGLEAEIDGWMTRLVGAKIRRGFESAIFTWLYSLKNYTERGAVKVEGERMTKIPGRLPKKKISFLRPFGLLQPHRRDDEDEN